MIQALSYLDFALNFLVLSVLVFAVNAFWKKQHYVQPGILRNDTMRMSLQHSDLWKRQSDACDSSAIQLSWYAASNQGVKVLGWESYLQELSPDVFYVYHCEKALLYARLAHRKYMPFYHSLQIFACSWVGIWPQYRCGVTRPRDTGRIPPLNFSFVKLSYVGKMQGCIIMLPDTTLVWSSYCDMLS